MSFVIKGELLERCSPDAEGSKSLGVPAGIKRVGARAFYECQAEEILLPEGIYYIGEGAFSNSKIKRMILPDSVITLSEGAFLGCDHLEYAEIPAKVEEVRRDTFWSCFRMKKCVLHEGIKKIQPTAFSQCRNAVGLVKGEYRVTLPYVSEWDMSGASKCLEFISALGTPDAERLFAAIEREDHKLPLAMYSYAVHGSTAAADYLSVRLYAAAAQMINDDDNAVMLRKLTDLGTIPSCRELLAAAEKAGASGCAEILRPLAAAEEEQSSPTEEIAPPVSSMSIAPPQQTAPDDSDYLDFSPTIEVFRTLSVDSAFLFRLKDRLPLCSDAKNGFKCAFDTESSQLMITVTNTDLIGGSVRELIYRAFFGAAAPAEISHAMPSKRMIDMDLRSELRRDPAETVKMLLRDSDIIEASEIIDEWSVPVTSPAAARQPVPKGATHEHCIYRNGRLEYYELFSWNVRVAEFEGGTLTELRDGADCEWDNRSLGMFIDSLPAVYRVDRISAALPDRLRLPYTCHTLLTGALELSSLKDLVVCRKGMTIGSNKPVEGMNITGVAGGAAEQAAKDAGVTFTEGFGAMRGAGRVSPAKGWSLEAPDETVWQRETAYMSPMLELINCSGAAEGKTLSITFITEKLPEEAADGLENAFSGRLFHTLYKKNDREIGLGVELYVFRMGEISGLTAATYYISGYVRCGEELTTLLTSYVGGPDEAVAAVESVCGLMQTIEFDGEGETVLAEIDREKLSAELTKRTEQAAAADKAAADAPSRVIVSNDWALTVPRGYVWSVDPDVIRGHRCLLILHGGEGGDVGSYYGATESYSCMASQGPICSGDLREYCNKLRIRKLGLMSFGNGSPERRFVLKHTSDVAVFVQLQEYRGTGAAAADGSANAVFRAEIITRNGVYPMQAVFGDEAELVDHENRLAELLMSVSDKETVCGDTYMRSFFGLNSVLRRTSPAKPETAKHYLDTRSAEEGFDSWLRMGIELRDSVEYAMKAVEGVSVPPFAVSETAWELAGIFAVDSESYDPHLDREQEIKHGFIREAEYMTVFRSFAWLIAEHCDLTGKTPSELDADTVLAIAQLVESRGCLCYDETCCPMICSVPDTNTIYVPDGVSVPAVERMVKNGGWTTASLDGLRTELAELMPCMNIIHAWLSGSRDRSRTLRGVHSDILYVWCVLAVAANRAFAVTNDTPVSCDFGERTEVRFAEYDPQVLLETEIGAAVGETAAAPAEEAGGSNSDAEREVKSLVCGERISINDYAGEELVIEPGFTVTEPGVELDGYAFMLTTYGKVRDDDGFVFFGQNASPDGAVTVDPENSCRFKLRLDHAEEDIVNIVLVYAVYDGDGDTDGETESGDLTMVKDMDISFTVGGRQIMDFRPDSFNPVKSMAACEIYRYNGEWKIRAVGRGYKGTLKELCTEFGVEVE